jgi:predicted N-acetyltransferase YhbS
VSDDRELEAGKLETDDVLVRALKEGDLDAIVRIDATASGRTRREYYRDKVAASLRDSRVHMSLVAEVDGLVVGFLMSEMHYGEFGRAEPAAVIDSLAVHKDFRKRHVGAALMRQFVMNARAFGVEKIRTEVAWDALELVRFFSREGFHPGKRIVLERDLEG